jgi:DNA replication ATP-dependent helicase Dna2
LLKDWRRINVAFTRARSKLIIFGSRKTLSSLVVLKQFLELMENRGWILTLRPGADKTHTIDPRPKSTKRKDPHQGLENREAAATKKAKVLQKDGWKLPSAKIKRTILGDIVNNIS